MFSRACHRLYVFPRLPQAISFPALATGYMFSRACHRLHVFPRLPQALCFPALATGSMFTRACHRLYVFPRLPQAICFPAFAADYLFSRAYRLLVLLPCGWLQGFAFSSVYLLRSLTVMFTFLYLQLNSLNKENLRQRHIIDREAAARKVISLLI